MCVCVRVCLCACVCLCVYCVYVSVYVSVSRTAYDSPRSSQRSPGDLVLPLLKRQETGLLGVILTMTMVLITAIAIPFSFWVPSYAARSETQRTLLLVLMACYPVGYLGLIFAPVEGAVLWAVIVGVGEVEGRVGVLPGSSLAGGVLLYHWVPTGKGKDDGEGEILLIRTATHSPRGQKTTP